MIGVGRFELEIGARPAIFVLVPLGR
jgi:hypothetical protein